MDAEPSTLFLNLSKLQPMDVLAVSGDAKSSIFIKLATAARKLKTAKYSHSALVLSPSIVVESLSGSGIVLSDLTVPRPGRFDAHLRQATDEDALQVRKLSSGEVALFARLHNVTKVDVLRHRAISDDAFVAWLFRKDALEILRGLYLLQYAKPSALAKSVVDLPEPVCQFIDAAHAAFAGSRLEAGPFCSELVSRLLNGLFDAGKAHGRVVPADFGWHLDQFEMLEEVCYPAECVPGEACSAALAKEMTDMLRYGGLGAQLGIAEVLGVGAKVEDEARRKGQDTGAQLFRESLANPDRRAELRKERVADFNVYLNQHADPFWQWLRDANVCARACPRKRQANYAVFAEPGQREPPVSPFTAEQPIRQSRRRPQWDGESRCAGADRCALHSFDEIRTQLARLKSRRLRTVYGGGPGS